MGVDVFFVISGFLITSLIRKDAASGLFSVTGFFSRRIRRIFPALFVVVIFSTAAGFWLFPPSDFSNFGTSQIYTALFAANVHFWRLSLNYFAEGRPYPLLHAWSLGVEEQFYIAVPFAFLLITKRAPGGLRAAAITAFLISLGAFLIGMPNARTTAFYLAPFRAWEFLAGAMLAGGLLPPPSEGAVPIPVEIRKA